MSIALCMVVKNEARRIQTCLDSVVDAVDEINIIDTGSSDGTPELIQSRYGIAVGHQPLAAERLYTLADPLETLYSQTRCDWVLTLDGDEHLNAPASLLRDAVAASDRSVCGYFGLWRNHVPGQPGFDDYKLFVFRSRYRKRGLIHENAQVDIRSAGGNAQWLEGLVVEHHPEARKLSEKQSRYQQCLQQAMHREPDWLRYPWFLGYSRFLDGDYDAAESLLSLLRTAQAERFPVEALNARMVLSEMAAVRGQRVRLAQLLREMQDFRVAMANDFEVAINRRLPEWIEKAMAALAADRLADIRAYRFAC